MDQVTSRTTRRHVVLLAPLLLAAHAAAGDDPFADQVISYDPGSNVVPGYTDPQSAIGPPERFTGEGIDPRVVSVFHAAWRPDELVSIGAGGHLILHFDPPILDDPNNLHGVDFIIFGNAFLLDVDSPDGACGSPCVIAAEGGDIEVSVDGVEWHFIKGMGADGIFPTQGYMDTPPYHTVPGVMPTHFTRPIDPGLDLADLDGATYEELLSLYNGSAGGTPVDISPLQLGAVSYVRISNPIDSSESPEIDAIVDVEPRLPGDVDLNGTVDINDLLALLANWGPHPPGAPPADFNNDGVVDVVDLLILLGGWS